MSAQKYEDPRPKEYFDRFHRWARKHRPLFFVHGAVRLLVWLILVPYFRVTVIGLENVPLSGPIILAPNHNSFLDHFFVGIYVRRHMRFWAKSNLYQPVAGWFFTLGGTFCGRRGAKPRDEEAFITARTILERGYGVTMYCEGGRSRSGEVAAEAKSGISYLQNATGATVVPVVVSGSEYCRNWKKFWWNPKKAPKITVEFCPRRRAEPWQVGHEKQVANEILDEIRLMKATMIRPSGWFTDWIGHGVKLLATYPVRIYRQN